jgi:ABC-type lipoprotein release transport system permease subunit
MLPWEYGVRNLFRRPLRTALTLVALATVVMLILVLVGFIRGLQRSLAISGDPQVVLVYSVNSEENLENSSIAARTPTLLTASLPVTVQRYGVAHASPELYLGTRIRFEDSQAGLGLVRGVKTVAPMVRRSIRLVEGAWPRAGEIMVGRLAAAKLGAAEDRLAIGKSIQFEGRSWNISGTFAAGGAAFESEVWCNLQDLRTATKRQDLSMVALLLSPRSSAADVKLFCKERTDLELAAVREVDYYAAMQKHYRPVRLLAWTVVLLVSASGIFAGMNTMYGAVAGRVRELAALQAIGFRRRAILLSLIQEGVLLSAAGSLISGAIALTVLRDTAVRFTMAAFTLHIDAVAVLIGCSVGLLLGVLGTLPPAVKALRMSVAVSLKAV